MSMLTGHTGAGYRAPARDIETGCRSLIESAGIDVNRIYYYNLSEEAKIQVTDETLTNLMKFITDKYNAIDFSEIERSAGDYSKFKYREVIDENITILENIYKSTDDPGAAKYLDVINACITVRNHLISERKLYSGLYKSGNGLVQLLYTSMVASIVYSIGILISNTIRFVTTEEDTDITVLYDEIPGTYKHVHIKNVLAAADAINDKSAPINKLLQQYANPKSFVHESVGHAAVIAALVVSGLILLLPRIIVIIREIIYSVYFCRVRIADMLQIQIDLINTNIESLEAGRGTKKVIAKQKNIVQRLEKWKNRIALKNDVTTTLVKTQKAKENSTLRVDSTSPYSQDPETISSGDLLL